MAISTTSIVRTISPSLNATSTAAMPARIDNRPRTAPPAGWNLSLKGVLFRQREPVSPRPSAASSPSISCTSVGSKKIGYVAILGSIGTGAYAQVRLGIGDDYQLYALKTFRKRPKTVSIRSYLKAISAEYCIASAMDHPNVVKTLDLSLDRKTGQYFTTMEYCDKEDLCTAIARNSLSIDQKRCFMRQILDGVAYLHSVGIAHRDLKPENLLIHDRFIKIADFGVASVMRDCWHKENQRCYGLCGTVCYAAPEVFFQDDQEGYLGDQADMWSVGTIFYVLLVGELLFESAKMTSPFYRSYLRHHPIRRVVRFDHLGKGPDDLLYHLLDPDPIKRYSAKLALSMPWVRAIPTCKINSLKYPHSHRDLQQGSTCGSRLPFIAR